MHQCVLTVVLVIVNHLEPCSAAPALVTASATSRHQEETPAITGSELNHSTGIELNHNEDSSAPNYLQPADTTVPESDVLGSLPRVARGATLSGSSNVAHSPPHYIPPPPGASISPMGIVPHPYIGKQNIPDPWHVIQVMAQQQSQKGISQPLGLPPGMPPLSPPSQILGSVNSLDPLSRFRGTVDPGDIGNIGGIGSTLGMLGGLGGIGGMAPQTFPVPGGTMTTIPFTGRIPEETMTGTSQSFLPLGDGSFLPCLTISLDMGMGSPISDDMPKIIPDILGMEVIDNPLTNPGETVVCGQGVGPFGPGKNLYGPGASPYRPGANPYGSWATLFRPMINPYKPGKNPSYEPRANPYGPGTNPYGPQTNPFGLGTNPYGPVISHYGPGINPNEPVTNPNGPVTNPYGGRTNPYEPETNAYETGTNPFGPGTNAYKSGTNPFRPKINSYVLYKNPYGLGNNPIRPGKSLYGK